MLHTHIQRLNIWDFRQRTKCFFDRPGQRCHIYNAVAAVSSDAHIMCAAAAAAEWKRAYIRAAREVHCSRHNSREGFEFRDLSSSSTLLGDRRVCIIVALVDWWDILRRREKKKETKMKKKKEDVWVITNCPFVTERKREREGDVLQWICKRTLMDYSVYVYYINTQGERVLSVLLSALFLIEWRAYKERKIETREIVGFDEHEFY